MFFPASLVSREDGEEGHPHREDLPPSPACYFSPKQSVSLSEGLWLLMAESLEREDLMLFLFCFLSQSFQFHHLHKLVSIRGLVDSKPGHYPESVHRVGRTAGVSWLRMPRQCFPLCWQFRGFPLLLMVVGWVWGFLFSSFTHIANSLKGNRSEALSSSEPLTTAVNSDGAAQALPWCSPSASTLVSC